MKVAMSALADIEKSLNSSPSHETTEIRNALKNENIDKEAARSFQVPNQSHMASLIQDKLFSGVTLSKLGNNSIEKPLKKYF